MSTTELINVKILGNVYDIDVHDLEWIRAIRDHKDEYGFGAGKIVITHIEFSIVAIHLYGTTVDIDYKNANWQSVKKAVVEHILADNEFMSEWQDREFGE